MLIDIQSAQTAQIEDLGGKGFGLWQMSKDGLPVPPALVIPTSVCVEYMQKPKSTMKAVAKQLPAIKKHFMDKFGYMPLLSIRSGARVSMPGMMDTILNVGLDDSTFAFWSEKLGEKCATDSYCRLIEMYGSVVDCIPREDFEDKNLEERKAVYLETMDAFPAADAQILGAIEAVFKSWGNERAKVYRKLNNIPEEWGTAVVVQSMVFGNFNDQSATGVLFTRDPDTGLAKISGEFLINAQGEDVVAGIKTPQPLGEMDAWNPTVHQELTKLVLGLEESRKDVQDVEFTIQNGKLYILQTRNAKRSASAAVKIALDMVQEGLLTKQEAVKRVSRQQYSMLQQPVLDPKFAEPAKFVGIAACSGVATGVVVLSAKDAINCKQPCILVTKETTPDDIAGMVAAKGVITMQGGSTSHAAVVARGMNKPCIVGVGESLAKFKEGKTVSIDGATGRIWFSEVPVIDNSKSEELAQFNQLMLEVGATKLIDSHPAKNVKLLDLTDFLTAPAKIVFRVSMQAKMGEKFIVDISGDKNVPGWHFASMFQNPEDTEAEILALLKGLPEGEKAMFSVLCNKGTEDLSVIKTVNTLPELIMASSNLVLSSSLNGPEVDKVIGWLKKEGHDICAFGVDAGDESYLSKEQVVSSLLN